MTTTPPGELRRFVTHVGLFLLPLAVGAVLLLRAPLDRSLAADYVRGDSAERSLWVYDRIHPDAPAVEIAFLGTSRTLQGIDTAAIADALARGGRPRGVANLGYPRAGRNLHFVLAQDLLAAHATRHLIVEVAHKEHRRSHPMFGYLARAEDLWSAPVLLDPDYAVDLGRGLRVRLEQARRQLLGVGWRVARPPAAAHGRRLWGADRRAPGDALAAARRHRQGWLARGADPQRDRRPRTYLRRLAALAADHGARLHFLFLPSYGEPRDRMREAPLLRSLAEVWIPPRSILENPAHWHDTDHLNDRGRARLAAWLAGRLAALD